MWYTCRFDCVYVLASTVTNLSSRLLCEAAADAGISSIHLSQLQNTARHGLKEVRSFHLRLYESSLLFWCQYDVEDLLEMTLVASSQEHRFRIQSFWNPGWHPNHELHLASSQVFQHPYSWDDLEPHAEIVACGCSSLRAEVEPHIGSLFVCLSIQLRRVPLVPRSWTLLLCDDRILLWILLPQVLIWTRG